ncbi:MAG TPA: hypothetical protein VFI89_03985 [Burkholderiales bacterium]|nr:hypothetical protein [Burkholderiales bacterium]
MRVRPVLSSDLAGKPESAAIAGWESVTVELSAGSAGSRHVMVTLDADGVPISASDWVLYSSGEPREYVHENVGGRIEADGTFCGTRWRTVMVEVSDSDEPQPRETVRSDPGPEDVQGLMRVVRELLARAGKKGSGPFFR